MLYDHQLPAGGYSIIHCYDVPVLGSGAVACAHVLLPSLLYIVVTGICVVTCVRAGLSFVVHYTP